MTTVRSQRSRELAVVAVAALPVAVLLVGAIQRRWIDDDGFINLRVVRNLLEGNGPVFNLGERVEVFTSPLWIGVLWVLGAIGFQLERAAAAAGIAFTALGMVFAQLGAFRRERAQRDDGQASASFSFPLGSAVVAVVPAVWDYASSGLETGLGYFWLGSSYYLLVQYVVRQRRSMRAGALAPAVWFGLGPLIRPDFAIYSVALLLTLVASAPPSARYKPRLLRRRLFSIGITAAVIPAGYQLFRMGYFAAMTPNTAIAKEAFRLNMVQGFCYARNFFGLYKLAVPLSVLALILWFHLLSLIEERQPRLFTATLALPVAALFHGLYVVAIGGDYMHGRMLLPVLFAATLPVAMLPVKLPHASALSSRVGPLLVVPLLLWLPVCAFVLRVDRENVCGIGDERGWYARYAKVDNPVALASYKLHSFFEIGANLMRDVDVHCPPVASGTVKAPGDGCRLLYLDETDHGKLTPPRSTYVMSEEVDARHKGVVAASAVGIVGYELPSNVYLVDRLGLADPIGARLELRGRGRPGHEKSLPNAWLVARLTRREAPEDSAVDAARNALMCGSLATIAGAIHDPLTPGRFMENMLLAPRLQRLRVPADPFLAEERFCAKPAARTQIAGGPGGAAFRWDCPTGMALSGLSASTIEGENAGLSEVRAACTALGTESALGIQTVAGPVLGEAADAKAVRKALDLHCAPGEVVVGASGSYGRVIQRVQLRCAPRPGPTAPKRVAAPKTTTGVGATTEFVFECDEGNVAVGITGRAGALVDALGVVCAPPQASRAK